jgi:hypothetical protein
MTYRLISRLTVRFIWLFLTLLQVIENLEEGKEPPFQDPSTILLSKETVLKCIQDAVNRNVRFHKFLPLQVLDNAQHIKEGGYSNVFKVTTDNQEVYAVKMFKKSSDENEDLMLREIAFVRYVIF